MFHKESPTGTAEAGPDIIWPKSQEITAPIATFSELEWPRLRVRVRLWVRVRVGTSPLLFWN